MLAIVVALIGILWRVGGSEGVGPTRSDCQRSCGNLTIPYPFGIQGQVGCYLDDGAAPMSSFIVSCEQVNGRQGQFIIMYNSSSNFEILDISIEKHEIRALWFVARDCYDSSGNEISRIYTEFGIPRFPISSTRNTFTVVGCDTFAIFQGTVEQVYAKGCISYCESLNGITNGTCSGLGCCQTDNIPKNATNFQIAIGSSSNHSLVQSFNPCGYAFLAETGYFDFSTEYLYNITETRMPMILDWSIGNLTCDEARSSTNNMTTSYMCADNTDCTDAENGSGYRCHCMQGYQGNPYLPNECKDIDECETIQPCNTTCTNLVGTYKCTCPSGYTGDGRKNGTGCSPRKKFTPREYALGISIGFLILVLGVSWLYWAFRQRSAMKERKRFFKENGGLMLQQLLFEHGTSVETLKVFSEEELKKATNNYHESRILGEGGQGTVYKGSVHNDRVVAIKKAKMIDRSQVNEFIDQ